MPSTHAMMRSMNHKMMRYRLIPFYGTYHETASSKRNRPQRVSTMLESLKRRPSILHPATQRPTNAKRTSTPTPTAGFAKTQYRVILPRPEPYLGLAFRQANLWPCFTARASSRASCVTNQRRASTARIRFLVTFASGCLLKRAKATISRGPK